MVHRIDEYTHYMSIQKMMFKTGAVEIILRFPVEIIENLVKLNFSKVVDASLDFRERKLNLLDAELHAPHREVAYIVYAGDEFLNK